MTVAILHGVDPFAWLKDVLEKLASGWKQSDIAALLPKPALDNAFEVLELAALHRQRRGWAILS